MQKTVYQKPELRDANNNIIQEGAFGKNTALSNSTNDGWIDYVMNNLEALHDVVGETSPTLDANGHVVEPANLAIGDEDGNRIKDSYLKLSGGKVTGIASFRTDLRMLDNQDNRWGGLYVPGTTASEQYLSLYGGTRATGDARLNLYSVGNGKFELTGYSTDGANAYTLTHDNSGNLKWGSNTVAMLASPAFTGTPTAPTPANTDNSNKLATTEFVNSRLGNYLPLAGGTMTGAIKRSGNIIKNINDTSTVSFFGGTDNNGSSINLFGKNHSSTAGRFEIKASNGTDTKYLVGNPDGTFTWGGKNVLTNATVGTVVSSTFRETITLTENTTTVMGSISLPAGTWVVTGHIRYTTIVAGRQFIAVSSNASYVGAEYDGTVIHYSDTAQNSTLSLMTTMILALYATTTIYLLGYATASCSSNNNHLRAVRIV